MYRPKALLIILIFCFLSCELVAQQFYSNGATISVSIGGILFINGGIELGANTALTNDGQLTTTKNSTTPVPGNFIINGTSVVGGNGTYTVEQDWVNNAVFNAGNSSVQLFGNTLQNITSNNNTVTTFHNLALGGTGTGNDRKKVLLNVNARTDATGVLTLSDRELATQAQVFSVMNPSPTAIIHNAVAPEGFVSSMGNGYLSRVTNSSSDYIFPTGSSAGVIRYRPLTVKPLDNTTNEFHARLNNHDANTDGFDRNNVDIDVCKANPLFYHSLIRSVGTSAADVTLTYDPAADGQWEHMATWKSAPNDGWKSMEPATVTSSGAYSTITRAAWNFPTGDHPYILSAIRPLPPQLTCPEFCEKTNGNVFVATGSATGYVWSVPSMATITSGAGTGNISVRWGSGAGDVSVVSIGSPGCNSLPATCLPVVHPAPVADFKSVTTNSPYSMGYAFTDESTGPATWTWNFGDGNTSAEQSPSHVYTTFGDMPVTLIVKTDKGCTDQTTSVVTIRKHNVFIPNAFTPNRDGLNDEFKPTNNAGEPIPFYIYNRWGELIYTSSTKGWDGKRGGVELDTGVYIYLFKYKDLNTGLIKEVKGTITLIR